MSKLPSLNARKVVRALKRAGFVEDRQRGSHLKRLPIMGKTPDRVPRIQIAQKYSFSATSMVREPMLVPVIDPKVLAVEMLRAGGEKLA